MVLEQDQNIINKITKQDLYDDYWLNKDTYVAYIAMSDGIRKMLSDLIEDDECCLYAEYWKDEDSFHYLLGFDDDTVDVTERLECEYLNNLVIKKTNESSKGEPNRGVNMININDLVKHMEGFNKNKDKTQEEVWEDMFEYCRDNGTTDVFQFIADEWDKLK